MDSQQVIHPDDLALAKHAYEAYGATTDFKNYQGLPMPKFEDLPTLIQAAWLAACLAVIDWTQKD
jgi:hypothetical protein